MPMLGAGIRLPRGSRMAVHALALLAIVALSGCGRYWKNRVMDAHDIIDIGFTFSKKPQFSFYGNFQTVTPIGYGHVDGVFLGNAGGTWGLMDYHHRGAGLLLWGVEEQAYGEHDDSDPDSVNYRHEGVIGLIRGPRPHIKEVISCPHIIHLGWFGIVGTGRGLEIVDLALGLATIDIMGDDSAGGVVNFRRRQPMARRPGQGPDNP